MILKVKAFQEMGLVDISILGTFVFGMGAMFYWLTLILYAIFMYW
jgi:hypothetical protein